MMFLKQKMDAAQGFIDAVKQRQNTLMTTMQAIIDLQRPFFLEGDESLLKPMILKDVAERTGLDISTISVSATANTYRPTSASIRLNSSSAMAIRRKTERKCPYARYVRF